MPTTASCCTPACPTLALVAARAEVWKRNPTYPEMSRRLAQLNRGETVTKNTGPTLAQAAEEAIRRRAMMVQAEPGQFGRDILDIRTEVRRSEIGRQVAALAGSSFGRDPFAKIVKSKLPDQHREALDWVHQWGPK